MQECLDGIKDSQSQQNQKMCEQLSWFKDHVKFTEILSELHKLTSITNPVIQVQNDMTQTTPSTCGGLCIVHKQRAYYESTRVCRTSFQPQPAQIDNYQLCDTKAVCTDILPKGSSHAHENVYQKTLSDTTKPRPCGSKFYVACSCCQDNNEDTSSFPTVTNSNHTICACPVGGINGLSSQTFIPGDVELAEDENDSKSNSPSIQKMPNNKEKKRARIFFSPSVKCNPGHSMWPDSTIKNNKTGAGGSAVTCGKIGTRRCRTKLSSFPFNKERIKLNNAPDKSNSINAGLKKATSDELKIKPAPQKQSNGSEKKSIGKASYEKRRYPLEGLQVKDETWQEQAMKRNYLQQQKGRKEFVKVAKRNPSWQHPIPFQDGILQNGRESEHLLQSWFSPLTPAHENYSGNPADPSVGKDAQTKTKLNFFDSSEDSD